MKNLLFFLIFLVSFSGFSQNSYWKKVQNANVKSKMKLFKEQPVSYKVYELDKNVFIKNLEKSPQLTNKNRLKNILIPTDEGKMKTYEVFQSGTMSTELKAKYPSLRTYRIFSKNHQEQGSIVVSKWGVFIEVFRAGKSPFLVQPVSKKNNTYMVYNKKSLPKPKTFECFFDESESLAKKKEANKAKSSDNVLRRYRYAVGTTGEYSQYHIQLAINAGVINANATDAEKKLVVLAAVTTTIDRLNTVYERDLGVQLSLVPNEDQVIFLDPDTDPYDNADIMSMLNVNTQVLNDHLGVNNYDGGHLFTTYPGGGISGLGVICEDNQKARSVTGSDNPIGDPYDIDYVAHEVGHSFGANHTFANSCNDNRNTPTSVEPGSGSTIMAYAGICAPNVQGASDAYFHITSIKEITNFISFQGNCAQIIDIGNTAPVIQVETYANKYIPKSTPFMLSAQAVDNENDMLTFGWEEQDVITDDNIQGYTPVSTNVNGPMFRSYWPTERGIRYFPQVAYILNGTYGSEWEVLPEVSRFLTFEVTVRDNHPGGGQSPHSALAVQVDASTGPFRVTSQGADETWLPGETKTITWNVAGTTEGNVACPTVDILLSTDHGQTFTYVLADNVPNDGNETINVPANLEVANAYLMVKGHDRYFFDLAKGRISIGNFQTVCDNFSTSPGITIPDNNPAGISSTLVINDNGQIEDINIPVNISHTYIRDLYIKLTSPAGTEVVLYDRNCNNQQNIVATFDDQGQALNCGNLSGDVIPVGILDNFAGENMQGTWTLFVSDSQADDIGTLNSWGIEFCKQVSAGINEDSIPSLKIWPNPTKDLVNISFEPEGEAHKAVIKIIDLSGRIIISQESSVSKNQFTQKISTSGLSKGIYLIQINYGVLNSTQKLIIK